MGMFVDTNGRSKMPTAAGAMGLAGEVAEGMEAQTALLHSVLEALDTRIEQVAITNEARDPVLQKDFPVEGISRWIIHRLATGGHFTAKAAAHIDVLASNPNRLGGTIVNSGTVPVVLKLTDANTATSQPQGIAEIYLAANGGAWDFRLANMAWCGAISAITTEGEAVLRVVEV